MRVIVNLEPKPIYSLIFHVGKLNLKFGPHNMCECTRLMTVLNNPVFQCKISNDVVESGMMKDWTPEHGDLTQTAISKREHWFELVNFSTDDSDTLSNVSPWEIIKEKLDDNRILKSG